MMSCYGKLTTSRKLKADEGLTVETSAFHFLCSGKVSISTQMINPFLVFKSGIALSFRYITTHVSESQNQLR